MGAICHSSEELKYYHEIFPKCKNKIFFVPYGKSYKTKDKNISISVATPYFFSGGTSNRDYSTLIAVATKMKYDFVVACTPKDITGISVPDNVMMFFDAYDEKFDLLINSSYAVILTLENTDISSGQLVLLKAMEMGKPIVATRGAGILDYVDDTCAFLVDSKNVEELERVLEFIVKNPEEAKGKAEKAKKRHWERFTIQKFAFSIAEVVIGKDKDRPPLV
jgi:glycosyltransferase involved in cell wall biosynthesis